MATYNRNFAGSTAGAYHPRVQTPIDAFQGVLGFSDKAIHPSLSRASEATTDKKILADLWHSWDGFNWQASDMMRTDLSSRLDEYLDFFPIMDKEIAINTYGMKFLGDVAFFDEWEFPTFVIEDTSKRVAPRMNQSTRKQRSMNMTFKANGFEAPMDFVTDPGKLMVFIQEMQRLNDNIKQTWAYRILETIIHESLTVFYEDIHNRLPFDHEVFMDEYAFRNDMLVAIQKSGTRFDGIESKVITKMRNRGADPDRVVNPAGSRRFLKLVIETERVVSEVGSNALPQNKNLELDIPQPTTNRVVQVAYTELYGLRIHETRVFDLGDNMEAKDPCVYPLTISHFWRMEPNERMDPKEYCSDSRTIEVCDGELGKFSDITLKNAFLHCGIFHGKGGAKDESEMTPEGRTILKVLCSARSSSDQQYTQSIRGVSGSPDHHDPDFDCQTQELKPPYFGQAGSGDLTIGQDDLQWDCLPRCVNAYTLFKRAQCNLLNDVIGLFRCMSQDKYNDFVQILQRQRICAGKTAECPEDGSSSFSSSSSSSNGPSYRTYGHGASGTRQGGSGGLFDSILGSSRPSAPNQTIHAFIPPSFDSTCEVKENVNKQTKPIRYLQSKFQTTLTPLPPRKNIDNWAYSMVNFVTGSANEAIDNYDKWQNLLECVQTALKFNVELSDTSLLIIGSKISQQENLYPNVFQQIFDSKTVKQSDLMVKVVLNIVLQLAVDSINDQPSKTKFDDFKKWHDFAFGESKDGKTPASLQKFRRSVTTLMDEDKNVVGRLYEESSKWASKDQTATFNGITGAIANANGQDNGGASGGGVSSNANLINTYPAVFAFLGVDAKSAPDFKNASANNWTFVSNLVTECIKQSDVVSGYPKLVIQHFIILLLTDNYADTPNPGEAKKVARDIQTGGAATAISAILKSERKFLKPEQSKGLADASARNRRDAKRRRRAIREQEDYDFDDDDEEEERARRRANKSGNKKGKYEDCEPCFNRSIADVCTMLYNMRLTRDFFLKLIEHNIPFPATFDILQMWIRLKAGCTVFLRTGIATGLMAINDAAMMFSRNPETFTVRVFARFSCGTFIRTQRNLEFVPHTYCTGYSGGGGLVMFDYDMHLQQFRMGSLPFHCIPIINPYWFKHPIIHMDITGQQSRDMYAGSEDNWSYPTSTAYGTMMQWSRHNQSYAHVFSRNFFAQPNPITAARGTTIATVSSSYVWEPSASGGKGSITKRVNGKSPLGVWVQPGDFDTLRGSNESLGGRGIEAASKMNSRRDH